MEYENEIKADEPFDPLMEFVSQNGTVGSPFLVQFYIKGTSKNSNIGI
jgi:hypothetical protein